MFSEITNKKLKCVYLEIKLFKDGLRDNIYIDEQ